jgi:glycine betaine/proline transport system ATP-binding protein
MEEEKKPKIKVENVYKIFGHHPDRAFKLLQEGQSKEEILKKTKQTVGVVDASFTVYEGETLVIMGLSGSGKSTLLRCINRLIPPTYGKVYVDDTDVLALDDKELLELRRKKFGMVFQRFALFPHRTVRENVEYGLEIQDVDLEERRKKTEEAI